MLVRFTVADVSHSREVLSVRSPTVREGPAHGDVLTHGLASDTKKSIDELAVCFYYRLNTGKEVIKKYMSSNHSEVAET
jgi:hypothetical protein